MNSVVLLVLLARGAAALEPALGSSFGATGNISVGDDVTVSGLSAGASMASQVAVALSSRVRGAAIFAGKPYWCEQAAGRSKYNGTSDEHCRQAPEAVDVGALVDFATEAALNSTVRGEDRSRVVRSRARSGVLDD